MVIIGGFTTNKMKFKTVQFIGYFLHIIVGVFFLILASQVYNKTIAGESYIQDSSFPEEDKIRVIRWNPGYHWKPNIEGYDGIFEGRPVLNSLQFYYANWKDGYPNIFANTVLDFFYSYYGVWTPTTGFPDLTDSDVRYMIFDYSWANSQYAPSSFPNNWASADKIERIYLRRCNLTTAQVDGLISSLETQVNNGMGTSYGGTHYLYFYLEGFGRNEDLTLATHTANGWTHVVVGSSYDYLSKTINGTNWRVYFNDI